MSLRAVATTILSAHAPCPRSRARIDRRRALARRALATPRAYDTTMTRERRKGQGWPANPA